MSPEQRRSSVGRLQSDIDRDDRRVPCRYCGVILRESESVIESTVEGLFLCCRDCAGGFDESVDDEKE